MARPVALTPMRQAAARQMRRTASQLDADHPETIAGDHVRDAARVLEHGSTDGAKRHLDAAMEVLTPRNLYRHGITDDEGHATAKHHMHAIHRSRLAVQDIEEAKTRNQQITDALRATRETISQTDAAAAPPPRRPAPPPAASGADGGAGPSSGNGQAAPAPTAPGAAPVKRPRPQIPAGKPVPPRPVPPRAQLAGSSPAVLLSARTAKYPVSTWTGATGTGTAESATTADLRAIMRARIAGRGRGTGLRSTAGPARASRTTGRSAAAATSSTTVGMRGNATAGLWSPSIGSVRSGGGGPASLTPRSGASSASARARSATSSAGGTGRTSISLSARTAMLERTPAPRGRPGGPGLYDVKGLGHTAYFQQVVKALIEKRGMPKDRAYKIAWGALRRWRRGGGHVHPEVRAAATGALIGEAARGAIARASHGHAVSPWEMADLLIELAADDPLPSGLDVAELLIDLAHAHYNPAQPRDAHGRWTRAGGATAVLTRPPAAAQFLHQQPRAAIARPVPVPPAAQFLHQPLPPPRPKLTLRPPPPLPPPPPDRPVTQTVLQREEQKIISTFRDALAKLEAEHKAERAQESEEDRRRRRRALAWHGGLILAGAALAAITGGIGAPAALVAAAPAAPSLVQELIDFVKKLS
jgi:hypothetical protein